MTAMFIVLESLRIPAELVASTRPGLTVEVTREPEPGALRALFRHRDGFAQVCGCVPPALPGQTAYVTP